MAFFNFVKMKENNETHLYLDGEISAEYPWWNEKGEVNSPKEFRRGMEEAEGSKLVVHVNSPGGDLSAGIAIFEMLRQYKGETVCEITFAASAASLIPCACKRSLISPAGVVMIHKPSIYLVGTDTDIERAKECYEVWLDSAVAAYQNRIKKTRDEVYAIMDKETYFNAHAAIELGICDEIMPAPAQVASMQYDRKAVMRLEGESFSKMNAVRTKEQERDERQAIIKWAKER